MLFINFLKKYFNKEKIFDVFFCLRKYPEFRLYNESPELIRSKFYEKYGHVECVDPDFNLNWYCKANNLKFKSLKDGYYHWLNVGQKNGFEYNQGKNTILKIVLKSKDQIHLLEPWILYYSKLIGPHNIIILDNYSQNPAVLELYQKYNLLVFYIESIKDKHDTFLNKNFFELLNNTSLYNAILDTDEFLCFFDDGIEVFQNNKLLPYLLANSQHKNFSTTWIMNCFGLKDFESIFEITKFNLNDNFFSNSYLGKSIFRNIDKSRIRGHNITTLNLNTNSNLILLHLRNSGIELRKNVQISFLLQQNSSWSNDSLLNDLTSVVNSGEYQKKWNGHIYLEVFKYLSNSKEYYSSLNNCDEKNYFKTNIIESYINNTSTEYKFKSEKYETLKEMIDHSFEKARSMGKIK